MTVGGSFPLLRIKFARGSSNCIPRSVSEPRQNKDPSLFSRAQLDVGIGVAIYLSEGIADDNAQLLNRARCGAYLRETSGKTSARFTLCRNCRPFGRRCIRPLWCARPSAVAKLLAMRKGRARSRGCSRPRSRTRSKS